VMHSTCMCNGCVTPASNGRKAAKCV
jgi:hypothetical protein